MKASHFSTDIQEFLLLLQKFEVRYVVIGGEAVIYYGNPRLTGDIDFYYQSTDENVEVLYNVLLKFWGDNIPGSIEPADLKEYDSVFQFGIPPNRIDLLNNIGDLSFDDVWQDKKSETISITGRQVTIYFIGLHHLIMAKEKAGRNKDLDDLKYLQNIKNENL